MAPAEEAEPAAVPDAAELSHALLREAPETARSLARALAVAGIRCFVEDEYEFSPHVGHTIAARSTLFVDPRERERAELVVGEWRLRSRDRVQEAVRRVRAVLVTSSLLPLAFVAFVLATSREEALGALAVAALLWLGSLVVVGLVESRRHEREHIARPPGIS